jgi:HSP20 family protein
MTDQIAAQLRGLHFSACRPADTCWQPAVNVYAYEDRLEVCMDLAGVDKREIRVDVEPRRLTVSGHRALPENGRSKQECGRILVMEIEDGPFGRTLEFTTDVDTSRVEARQDNGWLWIVLPRAGAQQGGVS